jgi:aspartate dehydrogenase
MKVGMIGFGAVGSGVAQLIEEGAAGPVQLIGVLVREPSRYEAVSTARGIAFVADVESLVALAPDIVLECGGHDAFRQHVPGLLAAGTDVIAISVGVLAEDKTLAAVQAAAEAGGGRLRIPSGAIAALDAIAAASLEPIERVTHTVRKPPHTLLPEAEADEVVQSGVPRTLFDGLAREAVRLFPANVNVVAAVSLAGIGLDRTQARVVADPSVVRNTHEVEVEGAFGRLSVRMENIPSENPKTGRIVRLSLVRTLRAMSDRVVIGG